MKQKSLTTTRIKGLKPKEKSYMRADGEGLYLEVHPSGMRVWCLRHRRDGRPAKKTIGRWPALSLDQARKKLADLKPTLFSNLAGITVSQFCARYVREQVARNRKEPGAVERYIERDILPSIGQKEIDKVNADDLRVIIFQKREQGHLQAALALRDILKRMFDYALVCGVVAANPVLAIPRKLIATAHPRMRALSPAEVGQFVLRLEKMRLKPHLRAAFRLLLLTLTRKGELMRARWEHIDLAEREWNIPAEYSKTGTPHIVYLSNQAVSILKSLAARYPGGVPNPKSIIMPHLWSTTQPMSESTLNRALERITEGMEPFTVHDLRRTGATLLSEAEYSADVIEKALNHTIKGIRGVYNRAQYKEQRQSMLQHWADMVDDYAIEQRRARDLPHEKSAGPPAT